MRSKKVTIIKYLIIKAIELYRRIPLRCHANCKYTPSCSLYAIEALEKYGTIKGLRLAIKRILRCNPFSKGGYDPVP